MKNRRKRVEVIVDIIKNHCVSSQEELSRMLSEKGFNVTQATLSRDLKMLHTTKVPTDRGTYMYVLPDSNSLKDKLLAAGQIEMNANYQSGFVSLAISGNMAVIKTRNGYAPGLAYDIDISNSKDILGTIPGSNTIFAVMREGMTHDEIRESLSRFLPLDGYIEYGMTPRN
ncbi:MAG: ArgR family transcriptional regulator [Bacteroides sp.]|nr:ArgR family transcriptional regulator [Bacteroides sp.]MDE6234609.1 ArgR family transcriptional regulator [Muribaculaceae bacterium]